MTLPDTPRPIPSRSASACRPVPVADLRSSPARPAPARGLALAAALLLLAASSSSASPAGPHARDDLASVAARFAPVVFQDTAGPADYLTRFDFDGDWDGDNNWDNQPRFPNQAYVYWAGVETETHVFLTYAFFHPRDWSAVNNPWTAHENDLEGLLLVLERGGDPGVQPANGVGAPPAAREGLRPVAAETVFHHQFLRYRVPGGYPVHDADGTMTFDGDRPRVFLEAKGHGAMAQPPGEDFPGGDGVVYRPGPTAGIPDHTNDRDVSYRLLDIESTLWAHRHEVGPGKTYGPAIEADGVLVGYAFYGTRYGDHKANAPWGWVAEDLPRGQFFLDPAATIAAHYQVPRAFDREYRPNPFTAAPVALVLERQARFLRLHPVAGRERVGGRAGGPPGPRPTIAGPPPGR